MALFGKGKKGMNVGKKSMPEDVVSTQQPKVLSTAEADQAANDVVARTLPSSGNKILDSLMRNKNNSFNTLVEAVDVAKKANEEEQKIKVQDRDFKNAASQFLQNLYNQSQTKTTYEGTTTKEEVEKDIEDVYSSIEYPSDVALERLGVQDYFPDIGTDINVGTYSGRRVGSVSIFAAPGMTIPFGLLDARKRALAQAAQNKSATMQKIQELPDTSDQFNIAFKGYAHSRVAALNEKHNYDPRSFMRDKEAMAELYRLQTTAKAIIDVDTQFDELLKNRIDKEGRVAYYIPEELLKQMYDFQAGKLDNMEDYFSGKKNVSDLLRNARNYADGTRMVDSRIAELLKYPRELPISIKKGVEITEENIKEIEESRKRAASTGSYDSYVSVLKKFYKIDVDGIVDPWMDDAGYPKDSPAREWIKQYFEAQIPKETIKAQWDNVANKNFDYFKFNKEFEYKKEQERSFWQATADDYKKLQVDRALANAAPALRAIDANGSLSASEKQKRKQSILMDAYSQMGIGRYQGKAITVVTDPSDPNKVYGRVLANNKEDIAVVPNDLGTMYVQVREYVKGKGWVPKMSGGKPVYEHVSVKKMYASMSPNGTESVNYGKYIPQSRINYKNNTEYDKYMAQFYNQAASGAVSTGVNEYQVQAGYMSGTNRYPLTTGNYGSFANSKESDKLLIVDTKTQFSIEKIDGEGNVTYDVSPIQISFKSDILDETQRKPLEVIATPKQKAYETNPPLEQE
jgi:hypothetical protein